MEDSGDRHMVSQVNPECRGDVYILKAWMIHWIQLQTDVQKDATSSFISDGGPKKI
jgi:hypothetical protein